MKRYTSRPVEVSAFQFVPAEGSHDGRIQCVPLDREVFCNEPDCDYVIQTVHGVEKIEPGDWIVITDDGNWRKCCREAFEQGFVEVKPKSKLLVPSHIIDG